MNCKYRWLVALGAMAAATAAYADETITYSYDARGRLIQVQHAGTVNNGIVTSYTLDKADNRSNKTTASPPPGAVSFAVFDGTAIEGGSLEFTVTKTGTATTNLSVNYATANGTAVSGSDYTATSGTLTFAQNETTKTVTISTINNSLPEPAEEFYLDLSGATGGATISDSRGVGTISDNDGLGPGGGGSDCHTDPSGEISRRSLRRGPSRQRGTWLGGAPA